MSDADLEPLLRDGLQQLGLSCDPRPFLEYLALLNTWNQAYNLTAVRAPRDRVTRHVLDSLAILPWLHGTRVVDVGTGAGLPGMMLALACPNKTVVLLDSRIKKICFLREVVRVLAVPNVQVVHGRVEHYQASEGFDVVVSRAFTDLAQMMRWTEHLVKKDGVWLAMKGRFPQDELVGLQAQTTVHTYHVPGVEGERCCVVIKR